MSGFIRGFTAALVVLTVPLAIKLYRISGTIDAHELLRRSLMVAGVILGVGIFCGTVVALADRYRF